MTQVPSNSELMASLQKSLIVIQKLKKELAKSREPIAIIGMGCRFPGGADNPEAYWQVLKDGVDAITEVPADRWDIDAYYDPDPNAPGKMYTRYGGFLSEVDRFDAHFFGISPREAVSLDPQQRLLLEVSWEALEHANLMPSKLFNSSTGVFVGISTKDYGTKILLENPENNIDVYFGSGNSFSIAAGRLSYALGLTGPSLALDTACSSSLVAVHLAVNSLRNRESDLALAGGVNVILGPELTINFCKAHMMAADGRCKTFDATANGYVRSEGCGIVVLKRLSDAKADGDNILAVIRGSAVNQDGPSGGLTVPNRQAQEQVIRQALSSGSISPSQVSYIEAHGTGTPLGDPIEMAALTDVFRQGRSQPLLVGSVKTNLGHLESAAGIASLIKVVLSLQHQEIPAHLHFSTPNPYINWGTQSVQVPTKHTSWSMKERIAGVSSFGFGGTNAHVVLEAAPRDERIKSRHNKEAKTQKSYQAKKRPLDLLTLNAKTEEAVVELAARYNQYLNDHPALELADVCFTANTKRERFKHRLAVPAKSISELRQKLSRFSTGEPTVGLFTGKASSQNKIAFLFTGQGAQYVEMGRQLYETEPIFRTELERCDEILRAGAYLAQPLLSILYPSNPPHTYPAEQGTPSPSQEGSLTNQLTNLPTNQPTNQLTHQPTNPPTHQPALFALQYALAKLWHAWGVESAMVIGHGVGEYVAACVAGAFSLEDGLKLVAQRALLMQKGKMGARRVTFKPLRLPMVCNLTGQLLPIGHQFDAEYWRRHTPETVRFMVGVQTLFEQGTNICLEIGPNPVLSTLGQQFSQEDMVCLPSLAKGKEDWQVLLGTLSALHTRGVEINWDAFYQGYGCKPLSLPTYPWQRKRFWASSVEAKSEQEKVVQAPTTTSIASEMMERLNKGDREALLQQLVQSHEFSAQELELLPKLLSTLMKAHQKPVAAIANPDWYYKLEWQSTPRTSKQIRHEPGTFLILADGPADSEGGLAEALASLLRQQGHDPLLVVAHDGLDALFDQIMPRLEYPLRAIIYLSCFAPLTTEELTVSSLEEQVLDGCGNLLCLVQALVKHQVKSLLWVITRAAQPVTAGSPLALGASPLWGFGKAAALEHPELWGGMIDLAPSEEENEASQLLAEILDSEAAKEEHLAFRNGERFVLRLVPTKAINRRLSSPQPLVRSDATYLITGGLGTLGRRTAEWMVVQGAKHLLLVSRRGAATPAAQEAVSQLEQAGAQVVVAKADVSNSFDCTRLFEKIKTMPPLRGVAHLAGVANVETTTRIDKEQLNLVLAPKVMGSWLLHQLTRQMPLDFFVMFSSISSVWGSIGQAHYGAANHFLDVLAHYRAGLGLPVLTVNWGPWAEGGMVKSDVQSLLAHIGIKSLPPQQMVNRFGNLFGNSPPQITVADVDWSRFREVYEAKKPRLLLSQIEVKKQSINQPSDASLVQRFIKPTAVEKELTTPTRPQEVSSVLASLLEAPLAEQQERLTTYLQKQIAQTLHLSPQEISPSQNLAELGMDSLMALEMKSRLESALGFSLPITLLFETPNIEKLTHYLGQQLLGWEAAKRENDHVLNLTTLTRANLTIDLNAEAVLDPTITFDTNRIKHTAEPTTIFLTGGTGFLGAFLLHDLLEQRSADIYCLVRANSPTEGKNRLQKKLESYSLWHPSFASRMIPIIGDLSQPLLGLSQNAFQELAKKIDVIYHNGARVNFTFPYSSLKATNVLGTQEILRLASQENVKPLHYISTLGVFFSTQYQEGAIVLEENEPEYPDSVHPNGYTQSKWVAEKLVRLAQARGLPVGIYRPGTISGEHQSGMTNPDDFVNRLIKGCIQLGTAPIGRIQLDLSPVDYISQAIVHLSTQQEALGKTFHLSNPHPKSWPDLIAWLRSAGYPLQEIPYNEWVMTLRNLSGRSRIEHALAPFLDQLPAADEADDKRLSLPQLYLQRGMPQFDCQNTLNGLAGTSIVCPAVDAKLLTTYFSYFVRSGFLQAPRN